VSAPLEVDEHGKVIGIVGGGFGGALWHGRGTRSAAGDDAADGGLAVAAAANEVPPFSLAERMGVLALAWVALVGTCVFCVRQYLGRQGRKLARLHAAQRERRDRYASGGRGQVVARGAGGGGGGLHLRAGGGAGDDGVGETLLQGGGDGSGGGVGHDGGGRLRQQIHVSPTARKRQSRPSDSGFIDL
jgi:hypothetical protein